MSIIKNLKKDNETTGDNAGSHDPEENKIV